MEDNSFNIGANTSINWTGDVLSYTNIIFQAGEAIHLYNGHHISDTDELIMSTMVSIENISIEAQASVFVCAAELHLHNSSIKADHIYIFKNATIDIDNYAMYGEVHMVSIEEMNNLLVSHFPDYFHV